jgi:hypothetical protein
MYARALVYHALYDFNGKKLSVPQSNNPAQNFPLFLFSLFYFIALLHTRKFQIIGKAEKKEGRKKKRTS